MSNSKRNFYEILNATSTATFNQLKSNYKQLILQCHPDKMQQQLKQEKNLQQIQDDPINFEFVAITEAWNCLKDPVKRKQYDAELLLKKFHTHNNIYAHIKFSEMKKQPNTGDYYEEEGDDKLVLHEVVGNVQQEEITKYLYTYDCRCGGQYIVDDESAEEYCRSANNRDTEINNSNNNAVVDDDDDADSTTQNNKSSSNNIKYKENNGRGASGAGGSKGVVQNNTDDNDVDGEGGGGDLIVECSECSLVIILNG